MLVGEQIQLPFGCHRKDMGRCGIRTNLEVTISPKQRLCLVRISLFRIECDHLGWSIIWRDLWGWASRKPTKFCTLLFLCFFWCCSGEFSWSLSFLSQVTLSHFDAILDNFYFIGHSMKDVLNLYTKVAGRPMLPPVWGLYLGDSDCYNNARHKMTTSTALSLGFCRRYTEHKGFVEEWLFLLN